jgi:hypothetical protein
MTSGSGTAIPKRAGHVTALTGVPSRQVSGDDQPMADKSIHLTVCYYPSATKPDDLRFSVELMDGAVRIFGRYKIGLEIWPPTGRMDLFPLDPKLLSNNLPLMDNPTAAAIVKRLTETSFGIGLITRLLVVVGRFDSELAGVTYPDGNKLPVTPLNAFVFINTKVASTYARYPQKRSTLAHEVGHAAGMDDQETDRTELMYRFGYNNQDPNKMRVDNPTISPALLTKIQSAPFFW